MSPFYSILVPFLILIIFVLYYIHCVYCIFFRSLILKRIFNQLIPRETIGTLIEFCYVMDCLNVLYQSSRPRSQLQKS